jgi:addiction module HigA family antidote
LRNLSTSRDRLLANPHPGEILAEDFLKPMKMSQTALARAIGVSPRRINEIALGKRAITADTDLRLARYFNMSEGFFIGLQTDYELMERKRAIGDKLEHGRFILKHIRRWRSSWRTRRD